MKVRVLKVASSFDQSRRSIAMFSHWLGSAASSRFRLITPAKSASSPFSIVIFEPQSVSLPKCMLSVLFWCM